MTERRNVLQGLSATLAAGAAAVAATGDASAQGTIRWRVNHFADETSNFYTLTILPFARRVQLMTGGRLQIQPFPAGVISPPFEGYRAIEDGLADAGQLTPLYIVNRDPVNSFYGGHPGGMPPEMMLHWLYGGGGEELLIQHRRETMRMHTMILSIGPAEVWHAHRPIRTAADLRGVRFRAAGAWAQILNENFGAAATTVAGGEIYTMLERRGVDAVEWSTPGENVKMGLQNAAPYIMVPGPHTNAFAFELLIPISRWDPLPDPLKQQIQAAARLATLETLIAWTMEDLAGMQRFRESRAQIIEVDPTLTTAIRDAGRDWANKRIAEREARGDRWMRRVAESYYGFYDRWLRDASYRALD
ncbi:MAG: C4-dicarboxylate ABC transporter substrate-binding protein [Rubritepida sp.]|jgi:TRAP-type mannitol/chloroaromatic compound transport system substrate-binding protein|nr:C4-dicarboxylate ABC transporter substrate-binding protein [Rubritepida sp.]